MTCFEKVKTDFKSDVFPIIRAKDNMDRNQPNYYNLQT